MKPNTIIMLVGAIASGKSTLAQSIKKSISNQGFSCEVISSDSLRHSMLGEVLPNLDSRMDGASAQAFKVFNAMLESYISFPVNKDFVILDTTGLSEAYRNQIIQLASDHHYNVEMVVLDIPYKDLKQQSIERDGEANYRMIRSKKRLREDVMPNLNRKAYEKVHIIKTVEKLNSFADEIFIDGNKHQSYFFEPEKKLAVIGDVHECVEELIEMLDRLIDEKTEVIFLIGDLLDKGQNTPGMINFLRELSNNGGHYRDTPMVTLAGNHERYVYKALKGEIDKNEELENNYFTSLAHLRSNDEDREFFIKLYEEGMHNTVDIHRGMERGFILTHAPCANKFLGKTDAVSKKCQNNFYFKSREEEEMLKELKFIEEEADFNHPYHIFGHVAHTSTKPVRIKNKIYLDTGCVHGGSLSCVVFNGRFVDFFSIPSKNRSAKGSRISLVKNETVLEKVAAKEVHLSDDDEKILKRIVKGGARYISGTMAPARSKGLDIESLEEGLNYFSEFTDVVQLQPKYMGSRAQAYLHKDRSLNFGISRNGFRINIPKIEEALSKFQDEINLDFETAIIDCELLPWSALGSKLIDSSFRQYESCLKEVYGQLSQDEVFKSFGIYSDEDLVRKMKNVEGFSKQIDLYGKPGDPFFKGFDILELNGEPFPSRFEAFKLVNQEPGFFVDFSDPDYLTKAQAFFDELTYQRGFEGVVIKPEFSVPGRLPYMKVRNKDYLRIVYGFDYDAPLTLEALCKQKSIKGKSSLSIKEYELGNALLKIGYDQPTLRRKIIAEMMGCMSQEKSLDPRL